MIRRRTTPSQRSVVVLSATVLAGLTAFGGSVAYADGAATQPAGQEVEFPSAPPDRIMLHGTLLVPTDATPARPAPAVLLLPGSGPTDRDGNQPPFLVTNLLRDVASALASHGVATLRFDKRAAHTHAADWPKTVAAQNAFFAADRFVSDAAAAYEFLRHQPTVDPDRVAVLGHSEGGLIALELARDHAPKPAALILVSTCGRDLGSVLLDQLSARLKSGGADAGTTRTYLDAATRAIDQLRRDATVPKDLPAPLTHVFPANCADLLHTYFTIDPLALAAAYPGPVLVLQGTADVQVSPERDAKPLANALAGRPAPAKSELVLIPGASHNLKLPPSPADPGFAGPVAPAALDKLLSWTAATLAR
jgi:pimeloyl-ACP methyl ester carboxylesterase